MLIVFGCTGASVMHSDIATMLNHLRKCSHQTEEVKGWATQEYTTKYTRVNRASSSSITSSTPSPFLHPSTSYQSVQGSPAFSFQQFPQGSSHPPSAFSPQLPPLDVYNLNPTINAPVPLSQLPETNALGFSIHGSPNILPSPLSHPPSSLASYSQGPSVSRAQSRSPIFDQHNFNMHIGRMTVAAGLPMSWTDNPEVRSVFRTFFPWVQLPSRKALSKTILPTLQTNLRTQAQKETKGATCTLQCDSWTAINAHHLIAFVITIWPKVGILLILVFTNGSLFIRFTVFESMMHMGKRRLQKICWIS